MNTPSLDALGQAHLVKAAEAQSGRSAETVFGGREHTLRQTLIAMIAGTTLADHENPGEATLHVMSGHVRLGSDDEDAMDGRAGDLLVVPDSVHHLEAVADSIVLLTVAKHR